MGEVRPDEPSDEEATADQETPRDGTAGDPPSAQPPAAGTRPRAGLGQRGFRLNETLAAQLRQITRDPVADFARRLQQQSDIARRIARTVATKAPIIPASTWDTIVPKMPVIYDESWMRRLMDTHTEAFLEQIRVDIPPVDFSRLIRPDVLAGLDRLIESVHRLIPENLRDLDVEDWARLVEISEEQRVGLVWVPREDVLRLLLSANTADDRARVLTEHVDTILDDCIASLTETTHEDLTELVEFAREAVDTHRAGRTRAAQALATNVLDTGLEQHHVGGVKALRAEIKRLPDFDEDTVSLLEMRLRMVTAGIPPAYNGYDYRKRSPRFSRTGTAHAVNAALYTPENSLRAISLATVWLRWLHETWTD